MVLGGQVSHDQTWALRRARGRAVHARARVGSISDGLAREREKKNLQPTRGKKARERKKKIQRKKNTLRIVILIQETSREK